MRENVRAVRVRVGKNVQRLRRLNGLSQEQLAERVGNSTKHIGQVERGEVNVGIDSLWGIADALSISLVDLFLHPRRSRDAQSDVFLLTRRDLEYGEQMFKRARAARPFHDPPRRGE